ncbi:hypothetical protein AGMMS49573_11120 [Endomicrobiia bacterium]|nr:hypothetical protein AGMMS49573_11120 [Endomicrobiia bacterium]
MAPISEKIVKVSKLYNGDNAWMHVILSTEKNRQIKSFKK